MRRTLPLMFCAVAISTGCARVSVNTNLAADGSFKRVAKYASSDSQLDMANQHGKRDITELFLIPTQGAGISVERKKTQEGETLVTVTRSGAAGGPPLADIAVLGPDRKTTLTSSVAIRRLENGQIEYRERLSWLGQRKNTFGDMPPELRVQIKQSLPPRLAKTETIDDITHRVVKAMINTFFGPAEPVLPIMAIDPDLATRKLRIAFYLNLALSLQRDYAMTPDETRSMLASLTAEDKMKSVLTSKLPGVAAPAGTDKPSSSTDGNFMPLTFAVSFPGKIVRTNGLVDPVTGEVYWSLYDIAVEFEDITLELVVDPRS